MTDMRVSIILPTFNEAGNIVALIHAIAAAVPPGWHHEVLVVDDNSSDGTYRIVQQHFAGDPQVIPVLRTKDCGLAKSIRAGLERASAERIVVMDF